MPKAESETVLSPQKLLLAEVSKPDFGFYTHLYLLYLDFYTLHSHTHLLYLDSYTHLMLFLISPFECQFGLFGLNVCLGWLIPTLCSFLYLLLNVCLGWPVALSIVVQTPSLLTRNQCRKKVKIWKTRTKLKMKSKYKIQNLKVKIWKASIELKFWKSSKYKTQNLKVKIWKASI